MYSLRLRHRCWYVRYRDGNGRRIERRTPYVKDEKQRAKEFGRKLVEHAAHVREGLERAVERLTLRQLWERYKPIARQKRSWTSIKGRWANHILPALGDWLIHTIEASDVELFLSRKLAEGLSAQTVEHLRVHLAAAFTFAIKKARVLRGDNPARVAERVRVPPTRIRFMDPASMRRLIEHVDARYRGIFAVAAYAGLRKGEILGLKPSDVDLERRLLWVYRSYDNETTKGGRGRVVGYAPALEPHLKAALELCAQKQWAWLFPDEKGKMRTPDTRLGFFMAKALKSAAIDTPDGFSFKDLRASLATHLVESTGDLRVAQKQLGHSSPALTDKHYAFARDRHLSEQMARLSFGAAHAAPPNSAEQSRPTKSSETNATEHNEIDARRTNEL